MLPESPWLFPVEPGSVGAGSVVIIEPTHMPMECWPELLALGTTMDKTAWTICSSVPFIELHAAMAGFWSQLSASFVLPVAPVPQLLSLVYYLSNPELTFRAFAEGSELPYMPEDSGFMRYDMLAQGAEAHVYPREYWVQRGMRKNNLAAANWGEIFAILTGSAIPTKPYDLPWFKRQWADNGWYGGLSCVDHRIILAEPSDQAPGYALLGLNTEAFLQYGHRLI